MKKVFLDTNILMDAAESRRFSLEALTILDLCNAGIVHACASTMSFATMSYLLRHYTKEHFHETIKHITSIVEVIPVDVRHFIHTSACFFNCIYSIDFSQFNSGFNFNVASGT